ncbi:mercuric transporter MerT family protein [uncultured Massilia sp.]|uniref:mercuric transporter MerT family protein n=1 Tax=uncultured Massilia sp. TaxID=169973 RepID=UPI0025E6EF04|nr:mercuric transporter MerT family protein [uncultured Massilia sp.]
MTVPTASVDPRAERKLGRLMALAVAATLLASTCCVLPLVLVLVGITGAWMAGLQALAPVTPYALALALGALAWSGWLVFRPARACNAADGSCATTRPLMRRVWVACALFAALLLGFPLIAPLFY